MAGRIRVGVGGWVFEPWRGGFYPEGLAQKRELEYASRQAHVDRDQRHLLRLAEAGELRRWRDETPEDFVFAVKGPRFATNRRVLAEAGKSVERFFGTRRDGARRQARADQLAVHGDQEVRPRRTSPRSWRCCPKRSRAGRSGTRSRCGTRASARRSSSRWRGSTASRSIVDGDSDYPQIADSTAPFVYARIMGTREGRGRRLRVRGARPPGRRARGPGPTGGAPDDLETGGAAGRSAQPRDVFLYVISGAKERNPAAAMALIERV